MRVTILGASRFGTAIAERLIAKGAEVVMIDKDRGRLDRLAERLDCGMVEGDGTLPSVLRDAFRDQKDIFIAMTNATEDNILASIVARSVGFGRVIPQITSTEFMDVCDELELTDAVNPHATVAESICSGLEDRTEVDDSATLHHELALKRVHVPERLAGRTLGEIDMPHDARAIALTRDRSERMVEEDTPLGAGDALLFVVARPSIDTLAEMFEE